jgi:hypothetical protein
MYSSQPSLLRLGVELQRAAHGPVVSDSHGVYAIFFGLFNQIADTEGAVEHEMLRVDVQVGEGGYVKESTG